eukprot:7384004-Prymnesium_polylepis.1
MPSQPPPPLPGCTFSGALNFRSAAGVDDGSCIIPGCTDSRSTLFDPSASYDSGACAFLYLGCTDPTAANF